MPAFFSSDGPYLLQFLVIFAAIVGLMLAGYVLYRRMAGRGLSLPAREANRSRQPRLGIVDIYELDRQRQLILLRRDNVEHLLLVGGPNDVVVERNVQRGGGSRLPTEAVLVPGLAPDLQDDRDAIPDPTRLPPRFEMPVTVPPGASAHARPPPLDESVIDPEERKPAPTETGARARAGRFLRRTPPPLVNPRQDFAPHPEPHPEPPADATPPVIPASEPSSVDAAILSDMARQLEVALRRPSSAVTLPPAQTQASAIPPRPEPKRDAPEAPAPATSGMADPIAAGMAAAQVLSPVTDPPPAPPPPAPAAPEIEPEPAPAAAPFVPEPPPLPPAASPAAPVQSAEPSKATDPKPAANPFSVEEIEAEFARLLGRSFDKKT